MEKKEDPNVGNSRSPHHVHIPAP